MFLFFLLACASSPCEEICEQIEAGCTTEVTSIDACVSVCEQRKEQDLPIDADNECLELAACDPYAQVVCEED